MHPTVGRREEAAVVNARALGGKYECRFEGEYGEGEKKGGA